MAETYDVIVVGLGGFGSATAYQLAKRGAKVLGLEQFELAHACGSSHGETRIIRRAYFEHPDYVPLLNYTYDMWRELESESGRELMNLCGLVLAGPADGEAVPGVLLAKETYNVRINVLEHADASRRYPQFRFERRHTILEEQDAGYLRVDDCVEAHLDEARKLGAILCGGEAVQSWSSDGRRVVVKTDKGSYDAANLVIAGGAWSTALLGEFAPDLTVIRKPVFWFPKTNAAAAEWPVFYFENDGGRSFYGLPGLSGADVKVAEHSGGDDVPNPTEVPREMMAAEHADVSGFAQSVLCGLEPGASNHSVCMYVMSTDGHFIVDRHPEFGNVCIGAGFSGHGYKFTPIIGRALSELVLSGATELPVGFLGLHRGT